MTPFPLPRPVSSLHGATSKIRRDCLICAERIKEISEYRFPLGIRATRQYFRPSRKLYDLFIRPNAALLPTANAATLVIMPDSILRTMPFAALQNGENFLVERIALRTTVRVSLTNPRKFDTRELCAVLKIGSWL